MDDNRVNSLQTSIANKLDAGAEALRVRGTGVPGSDGTLAVNSTGLAGVTDTVATGLTTTAQMVRDADMEKLKTNIETQVREHPVRTLLVALGAGYILGKALRR